MKMNLSTNSYPSFADEHSRKSKEKKRKELTRKSVCFTKNKQRTNLSICHELLRETFLFL